MNNDSNMIKFNPELIKRLNGALTTSNVAIAEAALAAVAQDKRITVRGFTAALKEVAPALTTNTTVFAAAIKAAKEDKATLNDVAEAMAQAFLKKRADDRKRAAEKAAAAPGKALQKAMMEVEECKLALRTPLEVARDNLATAEARVKEVCAVLREERAKLRKARAKLAEIAPAEKAKKEAEKKAA